MENKRTETIMKRIKILFVVIAPLCAMVVTSQANLVLDGDLEVPIANAAFQTFGPGPMGAWTVTPDSVDLIGTYWQPSGGHQSLDLAGNGSGGIEQTIATTAGVTYRLTFDMSGNPDGGFNPNPKTLLASLGASSQVFSYTLTGGNSSGNMLWTTKTVDFVAGPGTSSLLSFKDTDGTPYGAALDNISLTAVPEPTTMIAGALLLLPFGASTLRFMRKTRVA
jgi:choice-of-anchor C domain-containing protein